MSAVKVMTENKRNETVLTEFENLTVGSLVTSTTKGCAVHGQHEVGVVYEEYELGDRKGISIIFERGGRDGWSAEDFDLFGLRGLGQESNPAYSRYEFENVVVLHNQYEAGAFNEAFAEAKSRVAERKAVNPWWWRAF